MIDNPEGVAENMSTVISDNLACVFAEQFNFYHTASAQQWKVLPKILTWSNITPKEVCF
jgi:hypothetical protein